jgi:excisionase family DNA binding protein
VTNIRLLILFTALLLVLLSITPLRRRLPWVRRLPGLELMLWIAFAFICVAAVTRVQDFRQSELRLAVARAALTLAGQGLGPFFEPAVRWVSLHQPGLAFLTVGVAGLGWVCVAARTATVFGRNLGNRRRLGDWRVLELSARPDHGPAIRPATPPTIRALMDTDAAARYLGVSRATVYRWVRTGRLRGVHAGKRLRFSPDDLAVLGHPNRRPARSRGTSAAR